MLKSWTCLLLLCCLQCFLLSALLSMSGAIHKIGGTGGHAVVQEKHGEHTFEKVVLVHPSAKASVEVYLHGATVASWKILGNEMLYMRSATHHDGAANGL